MNLKDVLKECPKAAEKYYEFAGRALQGLQKLMAGEIPSDMEHKIPDIEQEVIKGYAETLPTINQRSLFDFFDEQEVWIVIDYDYDRKDAPEWFHRMVGETSAYFNSRQETETAAFVKAFNVLEKILNKQ